MSDDMKCMKAPRIEIRAETHYVIRVAGKDLKERFRETGHMCGMKQLTDSRDMTMVVDVPEDFMDIVNTILGDNKEYVKASLVKASPQLIEELTDMVNMSKKTEMSVRQPVNRDTLEANGDEAVKKESN